jgi:hypothetical protein
MTNKVNDFRFVVNPQAAASFNDRGIVILDTGKGCLFSSNGTGARIWCGLEQQLPVEVIAEQISSEYQIARSTAREHTLSFLTALEQQALVQREIA